MQYVIIETELMGRRDTILSARDPTVFAKNCISDICESNTSTYQRLATQSGVTVHISLQLFPNEAVLHWQRALPLRIKF